MLTVDQALDLIHRLQAAAPAPTADKLDQLGALLRHLDGNAATASSAPPSNTPSDPTENPASLLNQIDNTLRPILDAIHGGAQALTRGTLGKLTDDQIDLLKGIDSLTYSAQSTLDSIQQLLALKHGQISLESRPFEPAQLLREAHDRLSDAASQREHTLQIHLPDSADHAVGDFRQTLIILCDLLHNAIHYTPINGTIHLSAESLGNQILFSVADDGIGIAQHDLPLVGSPFWRGNHEPLVAQHTGAGLRLYLAQQILSLQGGELIFSAEPNVGSTFSFTLPVSPIT